MSTFENAKRDAEDLAKLLNEDTDVTTRYGTNPKKSAPKAIREFEESANLALKNANFTDAGFDFATGGTIETYNQLVKDASGNSWQWQGSLPHVVTPGTTPSSPDYEQRTFNEIANISGLRDELDDRAVYLTLAQARASDLNVGQHVRLTDYGLGLYVVVSSDDTGSFYLPLPTGKLSLQANGVLDLKWFGAKEFSSEGASNHIDSTQAFTDAIAYAKDGELLTFKGAYVGINDTVEINKQINVNIDATVQYAGARDRAAIRFSAVRRGRHYIKRVIDVERGAWHGMVDDAYSGVEIENMSWSEVTVDEVENFTTSIRLVTSGGYSSFFAFNTFKLKRLAQSKNQILIVKDGVDSWFNSNYFVDIVFVYNNFLDKAYNRRCVKQQFLNGNTIPCDSTVFENARFEIYNMTAGDYRGLELKRSWNWKFNNYRIEIVADPNSAYFAELDCETDQILNLQLNPVMEVYQSDQNARVGITNNFNLTRDLLQVYKKTAGVLRNDHQYQVYEITDLHKMYRKNRANYQYVGGLYYRPTTEQVLSSESTEFYATTDRLTENGVNISTPCSLYLTELDAYDTFTVEVVSGSDSDSPINIAIKCWDDLDDIMDLSINNRILASNMFWRASDSTLTQSIQRQRQTFTVNSSLIKTLAILVSGNVNSIRLICHNDSDKTCSNSVNKLRQDSKCHILASKPTNTYDGYFTPSEVVANNNTATGQVRFWQFDGAAGIWTDCGTH